MDNGENSEVASAIRSAGRRICVCMVFSALMVAAAVTTDHEIGGILWGILFIFGIFVLLVVGLGALTSSAAGARDRKLIDAERKAQLSGRARVPQSEK